MSEMRDDVVLISGADEAALRQWAQACGSIGLEVRQVDDPLSLKSGCRPVAFVWFAGDVVDLPRDVRTRWTVPLVILALSAASTPQIVAAMRAGVWDVLVGPCSTRTLAHSLRAGLLSIGHGASINVDEIRYLEKLSTLSPREREILLHVVQGKMTKVIAYDLGISIKTVDLHRTNIKRKFGSPSLASLVNMVVTHSRALPATLF